VAQSRDRTWVNSDMTIFGSAMSAIVSCVMAHKDEFVFRREAIAIRPELLFEAAEATSHREKMRKGCLSLKDYPTLAGEPAKLLSAVLNASRANHALEKCDPTFSRLCKKLEDPNEEYQMEKGTALPIIERLTRSYWDEDTWYNAPRRVEDCPGYGV
jgi:hypothetical protein